jgi:hypothetical protein
MPIYKNETVVPITERVESQDGTRRTIKIDPGKSKKTELVLLDSDLTEVQAAPYYNPLMRTYSVTSTGIGNDQTIAISRETKIVSIFNNSDADVVAFLRALANLPGLPIPTNTQREVSVGCNVDQIVLQFTAAATIFVEERK